MRHPHAGVCVRLRDMVEEFFPEKVAARRAELEKQAAADRKRTAAKVEQEGMPLCYLTSGIAIVA